MHKEKCWVWFKTIFKSRVTYGWQIQRPYAVEHGSTCLCSYTAQADVSGESLTQHPKESADHQMNSCELFQVLQQDGEYLSPRLGLAS